MRLVHRPLSLILFATVLLAACQGQSTATPTPTPQWEAFHSDEGGFSVLFPAAPEKHLWSDEQSYSGVYTSTYQGMLFNATFIRLAAIQLTPDQIMENIRDEQAADLKAKILSSDSIEFNGYPGLTYSLEAPDSKALPGGGIVQVRVYQISDRLYILSHTGAKKNSLLSDVKKYLGSLKVDGMVELPTPVPIVPNAVVAPQGWQEFTSEQDGFSVLLPGKPKHEVTNRDKTMETVSYLVQSELDGYGVFLFNSKAPLPAEARPTLLFEIVKESLLEQQPAVIMSERPIQLGLYPGYEFLIKLPKSKDQPVDGQVQARLYVADKRLYVVAAMTAGTAAPPEITPFLDSFKILE
ncbi:hypothetical protein TFLX_03710 [Thermoflexales bacterium]|nr:hypothetical protein TFLX_03710 [Thermoflexales bacterium]